MKKILSVILTFIFIYLFVNPIVISLIILFNSIQSQVTQFFMIGFGILYGLSAFGLGIGNGYLMGGTFINLRKVSENGNIEHKKKKFYYLGNFLLYILLYVIIYSGIIYSLMLIFQSISLKIPLLHIYNYLLAIIIFMGSIWEGYSFYKYRLSENKNIFKLLLVFFIVNTFIILSFIMSLSLMRIS